VHPETPAGEDRPGFRFPSAYTVLFILLILVVIGGLALGRVRYDKWLRFAWPLLLILLLLYAIVLSIGTFFPDSFAF
jgi:uncharacterized ion transporter superfamily protein YfcC